MLYLVVMMKKKSLQKRQSINSLQFLGQELKVIIDRPLGSKHPKFNFTYPINYGYIPNTTSGDGEELDAYVLLVNEPLKEFNGICIGVIKRNEEDDDKLIIIPKGKSISKEEIEKAINFQEQWFTHRLYLVDKNF